MSKSFKTIEDVEKFLFSIPKFSSKGISAANFDLSRMRNFCTEIGNPQNRISSIHVAGTNGKGTTCRMLASVYHSAGYKTGLYTSPHLINVNERFKINSVSISNEDLIFFFKNYGDKISEVSLTFFEITTVLAFWFFAKENIDIAIIETGLGGRLDATNIIEPEASVITSIGLDHTDILGNSIAEIACEKGGVIKNNRPVIVGMLQEEALNVIRNIATSKDSKLIIAPIWNSTLNNDILSATPSGSNLSVQLPNRKKIDCINVSVAYSTVCALRNKLPIMDQQFKDGIEQFDLRYKNHAQFEKLQEDKEWYFDGAHNAQAIEILINHLLEKAPASKWTVVLSFMNDKLNAEIGRLWGRFPNICLYEMDQERAASYQQMKDYFPSAKILNADFFNQYISTNQLKSELVIFSGSFYFYSIIKQWMGTRAIHVD